ncbi:hypothetical protein [Dongia sp.]|uniref:hypothetical protein n=1 Tax=Dongia sp. TaxID=1977262 RepID=UPI0035B4040F
MAGGFALAASKRVAIVDQGAAASAGIQEFDQLAEGTEFSLGAGETIVIGYLTSCVVETITGGKVVIGAKQSEVTGGEVSRTEVKCAEPRLVLTAAEAQESATIAFRPAPSLRHVFTRTPLLLGSKSQPLFVEIVAADTNQIVRKLQSDNGRIDLAAEKVELEPGKTYLIKSGDREPLTIEIDPAAKAGGGTTERAINVD